MQPFRLVTDRRVSPARVRGHARLSRYARGVTDHWTGAEIKRRRIDAGLNQRQLADALGVSLATVNRWESQAQPNIDARNVDRLNQTLDIEPPTSGYVWTGAEIRRRRQLLNMTQEGLAKALGAGLRTIQDWERDATSPSGQRLARLHEILQLPEDIPSAVEGIALADAGFGEVLLRLVEIHNEQRRQLGQPPLLQVGDITLPHDLPEHDRTEGPDLKPSDQAENTPTGQGEQHPG